MEAAVAAVDSARVAAAEELWPQGFDPALAKTLLPGALRLATSLTSSLPTKALGHLSMRCSGVLPLPTDLLAIGAIHHEVADVLELVRARLLLG